MRLPQVLEEVLYRVDITSASGGFAISATQCESETINGDCGGSAYVYLCIDDFGEFFDGYFTFSGYCSEGVSYSGRVNFSGRSDVNTAEFLELSFSFDNLTVLSDGYSSTLAGTIDSDFSTLPVTITMDMLLSDNSTGKVYWIANYNISVTEGLDYTDVEISGRYYDPDYGYINIYTEEPLRFYLYDAWPSQGALVAEGEIGIEGSPTKARLTALSSTTYQVEVDINGDGAYDWSSGILTWSNL
ncbi:MAG: hypothetical protein GTN74_05245 [Proteobacteria bacterium]|nr:hypothetical protein [Pseudomonadota bacterium]NIS68895.1 hypothetical protein [Pseudomonadota bacterium]